MTEAEIDLVPPRNMADGKPPRVRVRTGDTVHRTSYAWSPAVLDLLQHVEREGFEGAPRALEGQELAWVRPADLARYEFPPADAVLLDRLAPTHTMRLSCPLTPLARGGCKA